MSAVEVFCSAGVNARSHCLAVSSVSDVLVYGSDGLLVLETLPKVVTERGCIVAVSTRKHSKPISVVKRVHSEYDNGSIFLSGGVDGLVNVWMQKGHNIEHKLTLEGCPDSVVSVCGSLRKEGRLTVISSSAGSSSGMRFWSIDVEKENWSMTSEGDIPTNANCFALSIDCHQLQNGTLLLATGNSLRKIELFVESAETRNFEQVLSVVGHSDWIHSISFNYDGDRLLLASAGQDTFVKIWNIRMDANSKEEDGDELTVTKNRFVVKGPAGDLQLSINLEAVLSGHEDWVHSTEWDEKGRSLVTSSSDKTLIVWQEQDGMWTDTVRLGVVGGQAAGFFAASFARRMDCIVGSSYFGGLHAWVPEQMHSACWQPVSMCGGHVGEVRDVIFDASGNYVLSVGKDQTTRVFAPVEGTDTFAEIARPQVHGHDMQCIASVSSSCFVSGGEEKIFRAFRAPQTFANSLCAISGLQKEKVFANDSLADFGARVLALGLSNKAIEGGDAEKEREEEVHWEEAGFQAQPVNLTVAPTEDCLQQNTLWPELHKLYGHGFEVYAIAATPAGTVLATACKASQKDHAAIILWDTSNWDRKGSIEGHQLTVTQLEWSPDGVYLLSVSRDRTACIYKERQGNVNGFDYVKTWSSAKEHSRIIWSCSWFSDSRTFATASRDMKVIVWKLSDDSSAVPSAVHKFAQPVTAVAVSSGDIVVGGLQDGSCHLLKFDMGGLTPLASLLTTTVPVDSAVLRLRFHPTPSSDGSQLLAYAGADGKTRIFRVTP